ncbi:hypothetical protein [Clostridium beijerinckii]|jgi:hypothetical protein|uniref:Uncharacterized protein n=1 Tax=Clostridium beijerinckii TaxID=1520 RepID=A0AAW3WD54_CLOBE|nr:hypothetical protein [Clostridium beijerinckii]MBC2459299.1 hypothetical protein [Clostridium beijerinckii]MBC2476829.1 hypothetical protein [Clostridium beijerinckii]MCI1581665.1 hypothetical protein [Clostridium beijerinckii]MCI1586202.1 hypothetical protein [Clostridium beijerinckii]MCI1625280.1 hypothetical protein [Clostridium beijerinckii]
MKKIVSRLIFGFVLFSIIGYSGIPEMVKNEYINSNKYAGIHIKEIKERSVLNNSGEEIGKRGEVTYNPDKITDEALINFYNDKIKNTGYNYYTLTNEKDKTQGIVSIACVNVLTYSEIDDNGYIVKANKNFEVK